MRHVWMLLLVVACGRQNAERGFLGESDGTIVVQGTERRFDGGALELNVEGERLIVVTTHGWHFTCEWAEGGFSPLVGGSGGTVAVLDAEVAVDEAGSGVILTDEGDVGFETFDCGDQM